MSVDNKLQQVEEFGFNRDAFPVTAFGHKLYLMSNDCYVDEEGRLSVHIILYCGNCGTTSVFRGRGAKETDWTMEHLHDVKLAPFGRMKEHGCW